MPDCLFKNTLAGIDQKHCEVSSACTCNHISCVLNMSRRISNNEFSCRCCEVPVSDINCYALLSFSPQSVGQQRKIEFFPAQSFARLYNMLHLVLEDRFTVVEQPSDQCTLPIIDTSGSCKPQ